ncbi:MAG: ATP-binding protein, partial [Clostridia bacterium]
IKPLFVLVAGIPVALVILMVIANTHTGLLFTIGETVDSYARGSWYILERIGTSGYLLVIFAWSVIKLFLAKEKSERKRYTVITTFALVPLVCDMMQVFFVAIPCTSVAFQITILIVYTFVSVAREDNIFLSASDRQRNNLQTALAQTAMSWYEFNVDKDHIYDGKIYIEKDLYVKRPEQVSESYSGYYQFLLNRVSPAYKEDYRNTFAVGNLKKSFEQGEPECSLQYWITDSAGEDIYIYQNIILTRDHVTEDLIGFAYTRDITAEERQKRAIEEQLSEITALNAELSNRIALIQSMSKVYFLSLYVNVVNDTFEEIRNIPEVRNAIGVAGKARETLSYLCESRVIPEMVGDLRGFTDLSTIDERMKDTDVITCEYVGVETGWSRLYMIAGDRSENGSIQTLFVASRMIHEEKQREENQNRIIEEARIAAEKASSAKTEFLFNMSHDIRTPMNAIIGFTDLLKKHADDKELVRNYIGKIETANDFLLSLINNVLEMARIESGKVTLDETANNMYAFWDALTALFDTQMKKKGITFHRDIRVEHPDIIVDETKIREILLNIVSNAVKYTPAGGTVSVTVTEFPSDLPGMTVYRTVIADTGIGMSEKFLPHIFDEFTRERTSTESKVVGTGLGMPIVRKLVDLMQGTITVESELGKGTKFTLTLSHRIAEETDAWSRGEHSDEYKVEDFIGKRILLAEDNELNAEIAVTILEEEGFSVERAEDGIICVDKIEKAASDYYDLVLMDIQMPNMDGYKATQIIRRLPDQRKADIPIIAMTANAFDEDRKKAFRVGMNGHIAKPLQLEVLKNTLGAVLSGDGSPGGHCTGGK